MPLTRIFTILLQSAGALLLFTFSTLAQENHRIAPIVQGLDTPWAMELLPDGEILITEKDGQLLLIDGENRHEVTGLPSVVQAGQGGLLDITLSHDFASSRQLFLTYAKDQSDGGSGTALASAHLSEDLRSLHNLSELFEMSSGNKGGRHFGSRVVQTPSGDLFITIGDRGDRPAAQDLTRHNGSVIRLRSDGTIPDDNPFINTPDAQPEIWSYGHRNPQGAGFDLAGNLWISEHGAKGGDEVNQIVKGANFGWPVISYGRHYSGAKIGEGTAKEGMQQPAYYWDPSMAPSGLLVYSGKMFPEWKGHILVGSLKFDYIAVLSGAPLQETAQIKTPETERVRDIIEGPDGAIWFISAGHGTIYRLSKTP